MFLYQQKGAAGLKVTGIRLFQTLEECAEFLIREWVTSAKRSRGEYLYDRWNNGCMLDYFYDYSGKDIKGNVDTAIMAVALDEIMRDARITLLIPGELAPPAKLIPNILIAEKIIEMGLEKFVVDQIGGHLRTHGKLP